jgi:hypothetical protein
MLNTDEILSNVVWLVDALDDDVLREVQDIPFLEMAKAVRIARQPRRSVTPVRGRYQRMPVRYPTQMTRTARQ